MNPKISFAISVAVAAWVIHDLMAPGEAPSTGLLIINWLVLIGSLTGAVGAVMQMQKAKQAKSD